MFAVDKQYFNFKHTYQKDLISGRMSVCICVRVLMRALLLSSLAPGEGMCSREELLLEDVYHIEPGDAQTQLDTCTRRQTDTSECS